ncbi:PQQ-dependent sugar dehydrogenase [Bowmanella dokdonensis]|uniref:PQQ-dependent sugar dehydrogenase n=1 Tax=Bowmanella dokdonensis TaxID=751969 RepID=A0A939IP12_9ALTE|nr:PQQ-dependent sugar dehydrogenase [Bowmanella dokdonensis]MBN7826948.1 PQQ-dependent sugar dehydrogenase [Bowmanella dokdonensis]
MLKLISILAALLLSACGGGGNGNEGDTPPDNGNGGDTPPVGLTERPQNATCQAFGQSTSTEVKLTPLVPELNFSSPLLMLPHPSLPDIVYVVQQRGLIYRLDLSTGNRSQLVDLADFYALSPCGECGLLGMAFDPDFETNGYLYLSFTEEIGGGMRSVLGRFQSQGNGQSLVKNGDNLVRQDLLTVPQPYGNHNGGHIVVGPDELLYWGLGDGGAGNDPDNNGQTLSTLLGSMLRLNRDGSAADGNNVPGAREEIYAWGLRNPWRFSFDAMNGQLWLADVGQNQYEEINIIESGGNYGWRCYEGLHRTSNSCTTDGPYEAPVAEYDHSLGNSVTGGYVYRGDTIPGLQGAYLFADFGSGTLWALFPEGDSYRRQTLLETGLNVASFAQDSNNELYLVTFSGLYRLDPNQQDSHQAPALLSQTGCVQSANPAEPADGLIPFDVIEPYWSDGASKQRFVALPDDTRISVNEQGDFVLPNGSVLMQHLLLDEQLIETRLYMRGQDANWRGYSYQWNEDKSDAELLEGARDADLSGQTWHYPSGAECNQCHTSAAGHSLGLEVAQLNRDFTYPQTGISANQLDTFTAINLFHSPLEESLKANRLVNSQDSSEPLTERARAYLHSNCSHCHRPTGPTQSDMDLRSWIDFVDTNTCNEAPLGGDLGVTGARLITPGEADRSLLYLRMLEEGQWRMPPVSIHQTDATGSQLIGDWINQLASCS